MAFNDYRQPIEYVVNQYFERKKIASSNGLSKNPNITGNISLSQSADINDNLPEIPLKMIRDEDRDKVVKIIYGDISLLEEDEESDPIIWQEELIYDDDGKLQKVKTTYPDGSRVTNELIRDKDDNVIGFE